MELEPFATTQDLEKIWRKLSADEAIRSEALLVIVSDSLREEAYKVGKDLDEMIKNRQSFESVVKSVTIDVVARTLMTSTNQEPMTQYSQGALGYTMSGTYLVPGGGLFIKNSELSRLGLRRQRYGVIEPYGD
ncbi:phage Gp19/Gp15/Gp42 family protein [Enterococcus canintestini]|uniref:Phage protein Gp19/Gp15/Gp42 n=1 Tax=Enterococcus canintestini TaxID=317010 RepID=A0A1L8R517_9ENTE|nr:phage Gp19/Gp15/Gp42 family protein [Enterococcus canintestini]OJG14849.1 phage protein Gp19/Gp15/Gp42 [Enterococcus canintestini]